MRLLIATLCLLAATASCATATAQESVQVRPLQLFEPLPDYVQSMNDATYREWAMFHNAIAYQSARQRAAEFNRGQVSGTTVTTTEFTFNEQNQGTRNWGWPTIPSQTNANGARRETTRTYSRDTWGGGPVMILNPYFRGD